jgi:uncharacterized protein YbaP (TraB family)
MSVGTSAVQADTPKASPSVAVLESVLVTGEQPGPGLWKISKDDHVLWIVGTFGPLPDKMVWRSPQLESVIKDSQEVYTEAQYNSYAHGAKSDRLLLEALQNPGGKSLKEVLSPELYQQFSALNHQYTNDSGDFENFRPFFAIEELRRRALHKLKLSSDGDVAKTIKQFAKKHRVKYLSLSREDSSVAFEIIAELNTVSRSADVQCASIAMNRIDTDLKESASRANAWAIGDIATLRQDHGIYERRTESCANIMLMSQHIRQLNAESRKLQESALREALQTNRSTVAMVPIAELFDPEGILAKFRADGYLVVEPVPNSQDTR